MTTGLPDDLATRTAVIEACRWMNKQGINQGTSGNVSVRIGASGERFLITPSAVSYDDMQPDMLVDLPVQGDFGPQLIRPSTEWRFHQSLLAARPDMQAVVHAHPPHATAIACQRRPLQAIHYMIAAFGGHDVPLAGYHLYGSADLARDVSATMSKRHGCLMANHGAVVLGETLGRALWRLQELEVLARIDLLCRAGGGDPHLLSEEEIAEVLVGFADYRPG